MFNSPHCSQYVFQTLSHSTLFVAYTPLVCAAIYRQVDISRDYFICPHTNYTLQMYGITHQ